MYDFNSGNTALIIYIVLFFAVIVFAIILLVISKNFETRINPEWEQTSLHQHKEFHFFLEKASAYRRIFFYFTFLSYFIKSLGILTTFYIIYALIDNTIYSKIILILSAMFDSISLLFPFQKYIDLFSKCCVELEEAIFQSDIMLHEGIIGDNISFDQSFREIYDNPQTDDDKENCGEEKVDQNPDNSGAPQNLQADGDNGNCGKDNVDLDPKMKNDVDEKDAVFVNVYKTLQKRYIECERILHIENKI